MDTFTSNHLATWAEQEFREDDGRDAVITLLTNLWASDAEYFESHSHSWWELLDIARRKNGEHHVRIIR
jgi:hypothetical protein